MLRASAGRRERPSEGLACGEEPACCYSCKVAPVTGCLLGANAGFQHQHFPGLTLFSFHAGFSPAGRRLLNSIQQKLSSPLIFLPSSSLLRPTCCREAGLPLKPPTQWGLVPSSAFGRNKEAVLERGAQFKENFCLGTGRGL